MGNVNKVTILGRVGADPEIKTFQSGGRIANLRIATSERWNKDGQQQERTEWHQVTIDNETLIGLVDRYVKKGQELYAEGQLRTRKWQDRDGNDRYTTEIHIGRFKGDIQLVGGRSESNNSDSYQPRNNTPQQQQADPFDDMDDDVPF